MQLRIDEKTCGIKRLTKQNTNCIICIIQTSTVSTEKRGEIMFPIDPRDARPIYEQIIDRAKNRERNL